MNNVLDITRDFKRGERDDFQLNVQPKLDETAEAIEIRDESGVLLGWKLVGKYE